MSTNLYIGNLPNGTSTEELHAAFSQYGTITAHDVKSGDGGRPAIAFISFSSQSEAEEAIRGKDRTDFNGRAITVEFARGKGVVANSRGPPKRTDFRIRITGLPQGASWQDVKDFARTAGEVGFTDCYGTAAVVEFVRKEDMEFAIRELDGKTMTNRRGDSAAVRVEEDRGAPPPARSYGGGGGGGYGGGRGGYDDRRGGYDDRRGGGYDDRRGGYGYDDRRGGYDDRRGGYDDRRGGYGYDDRRGGYDDRRGGYDDRRGGYDDRRGGYDDRRRDERPRSRSRERAPYPPPADAGHGAGGPPPAGY